jgi:hypothetical protein
MTTSSAISRLQGAGQRPVNAFSPGEVINARVTVRQGREDGYFYELACPITVQRPTDPSLTIYDQVKLLKPVDQVPYRAGDQVNLQLKIVSLHSVGRPNPQDGSTTVNVARYTPPTIRNLNCG